MKSGFFISSLALVCLCMWTLDLFAADPLRRTRTPALRPRGIFTVSRYGVPMGPQHRAVSSINAN